MTFFECPRCRQIATDTARRRGRCTACDAALVLARPPQEEAVRSYLFGRAPLAPRPFGHRAAPRPG